MLAKVGPGNSKHYVMNGLLCWSAIALSGINIRKRVRKVAHGTQVLDISPDKTSLNSFYHMHEIMTSATWHSVTCSIDTS